MFLNWNNVFKIVVEEFKLQILKKEDLILEDRSGNKYSIPLMKKIIISDPTYKNGVRYLKVSIRKLENIFEITVMEKQCNHQIKLVKLVPVTDILTY